MTRSQLAGIGALGHPTPCELHGCKLACTRPLTHGHSSQGRRTSGGRPPVARCLGHGATTQWRSGTMTSTYQCQSKTAKSLTASGAWPAVASAGTRKIDAMPHQSSPVGDRATLGTCGSPFGELSTAQQQATATQSLRLGGGDATMHRYCTEPGAMVSNSFYSE